MYIIFSCSYRALQFLSFFCGFLQFVLQLRHKWISKSVETQENQESENVWTQDAEYNNIKTLLYPACPGGIHLGLCGVSSCFWVSLFSTGFVSGSCWYCDISIMCMPYKREFRRFRNHYSTCERVSGLFSSFTTRPVFFKTGKPAPSPKKQKWDYLHFMNYNWAKTKIKF